ncbi:hypothetical protein MSG28_013516, partial [Choristoneura fumiferana]
VKAGFKVESDGLPLLPLGDVDEEAYAVPWPAEPPLPDNYQHPEAKLLIAVKLLSAGFDPNALYTMCWFEAEAQMQYIPSGDDDSADERFRFNMLPTWAVKLLLNAGASVACINSVGYTPLHLCLRNKIEELLEVLLYYNCGDAESSLRVQVVDNRGYSVLKTAVELNWLPGVCLALEAGADASSSFDHLDQQARREMKTTLVHLAVKGRNMRILDKVLSIAEQENLIDCLNTEGDTPLCVAIRNGHIECAKSLLHRGAGIENMSRNYCNALHIAAMYGRIDIMKYLLESVSDSKYLISVFNKAGLAPIHLAANNNNYECVQLLLKHGNCQRLATTLPDDTFSTALHLAAQHDYVEVAKAIISKDPMAVKDFNNRGFLPLHEAAFHCSNKTMLFFLHETEAVLSSYTAGTHENKQTAIQLITAQLPNPADFFETLFDSFMHYEQKQGQPEISVNYGFLTTRSHNMTQIQVIEEMVRCGPRRILLHPLMESLLHLKWKTLLPFFYVMLTIYGVFVTALNTYVVTYFHFCDRNATIYGSTPKIFDYTFWVFAAFIYTTISLMLILETFFITVKKRRYFMNFETWIKLSCMALVGVVPLAFKLVPKEVDWPRHVATAALLLAWLQMLFLLSRFPNWGYYVLMFGEVAANIFKILLTFVFLIIGFSLSFMIQYRSQDPFSNSWTAFVKTTVMMTQEFEYDDLFDEKHTAILGLSTEVARFLFALFLMFVGIVLMNFMVGVAVSNVNELNVAGNTKRLEKQVELLITLDYLVYGLVSKVFPINTYYKRYHWSINNFPSKEKLWRIRYYFDFDDSMSHDDEYIPSHLRRAIIKKAMEQCKNAKEETNKDTFEKKIDVLYESLVAPVDEKDKNGKENTKLDRVLEHLMSLTEDIANMKEQIRGLKEVSNKKPRRGRKLKRDASRSHSRSRRRAPEELYDKMNLVLQDIKELKRTPQLPDIQCNARGTRKEDENYIVLTPTPTPQSETASSIPKKWRRSDRRLRRLNTELLEAIETHDIEEVERLLNAGANPNATCRLGLVSACHMAALAGGDAMALLLRFGAEKHRLDRLGRTPLHLATFVDVMRLILKAKGMFYTMKEKGVNHVDTPLHTAVLLESKEGIELLLDAGAAVSCLNSSGLTPLHVCIKKELEEPLQVLASYEYQNADPMSTMVDVKDGEGHTVLQAAIEVEWVPGVCANDGETPVHSAAALGNLEVLNEILSLAKQKKFIDCQNDEGETPLFKAIKHGHAECVRALLNEGAALDITLPGDVNVLHVAADYGHYDILKYLLEYEESLNMINSLTAGDRRGFGPIHFAASGNHPNCVKLLLEKNADIRLRTTCSPHKSSTPLHIAAAKNHAEVAAVVLSIDKTTIHEVNSMGWFPLHTAAHHGSREVIAMLLRDGANLAGYTDGPKKFRRTAIDMVLNNLSKPTEYLEEVLDSYISSNTQNFQETDCVVTVNYSVLIPNVCEMEQMKVIEALLKTGNRYGQRRLLVHPLLESFLFLKWKALLPFFYTIIAFYAFFVFSLSTFVVSVFFFKDTEENPPAFLSPHIWGYVVYASICLILIQELLYMNVKSSRYFLQLETWVKFGSIGLATILPPAVIIISWSEGDWPRHVATAALLLAWLEMMFLLSRFPNWGYYVLMFGKVASNIVKILLTFGFLIVGFALSFMIQFRSTEPFEGPWSALVKTIVMMTSEFDYEALFDEDHSKTLSTSISIVRLMFVIFVVLAAIVLMNLMVGVAVSDINDLEILGNISRLAKQVEFLGTLDVLVYNRFFNTVLPRRLNNSIKNKRRVLGTIFICPGKPRWRHYKVLPSHLRDAILDKAHAQEKQKEEELDFKIFRQKMAEMHEAIIEKHKQHKIPSADERPNKIKVKFEEITKHLKTLDDGVSDVKDQIAVNDKAQASIEELNIKMDQMSLDIENIKQFLLRLESLIKLSTVPESVSAALVTKLPVFTDVIRNAISEIACSEACHPKALTLDIVNKLIFWVDGEEDTIEQSNYDGTGQTTVYKIEEAYNRNIRVFSWFNSTLYLPGYRGIFMTPLKGNETYTTVEGFPSTAVVYHGRRQPRVWHPCADYNGGCEHICVTAYNGGTPVARCLCQHGFQLDAAQHGVCTREMMYWSVWAGVTELYGGIEAANMDGSGRIKLVSEDVIKPNGLVLDKAKEVLYWSLFEEAQPLNDLLWSEQGSGLLRRMTVDGNISLVDSMTPPLYDIRVVTKSARVGRNACSDDNGGCAELCLATPEARTCACAAGRAPLARDNTRCGHVAS